MAALVTNGLIQLSVGLGYNLATTWNCPTFKKQKICFNLTLKTKPTHCTALKLCLRLFKLFLYWSDA